MCRRDHAEHASQGGAGSELGNHSARSVQQNEPTLPSGLLAIKKTIGQCPPSSVEAERGMRLSHCCVSM